MKQEGVVTRGVDGGPESGSEAPPDRAGYAEFFAQAAHDLRSPLGVILHAFHQLEVDLGTHLGAEQRTLLKLGGRGARRIQSFADRIGILAELESGKLRLSLERADLRDIVEKARAHTTSVEPRSEIRVFIEPAESCMVDADPRLLAFAVSELLRNGIAHARREVRVSLERHGRTISVSVEDDGDGLPEGASRSVFRRFSAQGTRGGKGVGLSIAHDLTSAHNGSLTAEQSTLPPSRPGKIGARFVLTIPTSTAHTAEVR